jgi:EF hand domain-containing protein
LQALHQRIKHCSQEADWSLRLLARLAGVSALALVSIVATSCGPAAATTEAESGVKKDVKSEYDKSGRLTRLEYDRNGDGKIDTWGYMDGSRVVRIEVDEDGDGKVDRWEYHRDPKTTNDSNGATGSTASPGATGSASTGGGDPTLERIERATKHDGKVSRREYFENGLLARVEEDTDGDGKIDKWETYSGGTLAIMAIDTKGRGTPDRRLIYQPDGTLSRIEMDLSGTGTWAPLPQ